MKKSKMTYAQVGDNYSTKDPVLRTVLSAARNTSKNLKKYGFVEIADSRGESAFVWDQGDVLMAQTVECLGTKNLVADEMRKITGKTYYDVIANDTVATFINDLTSLGAKPLVINAYWAIEDNTWMEDRERMKDFIKGWSDASNIAGATWGGGETSTLKGIINPGTIDLAGSAVGIIKPKTRLITDKKIKVGDRILLFKSNGVNANGISLIRAIAQKLPLGYVTKLRSGKMFGEEILTKTNIYARLIQDLLDNKVDIHYIVNITGHGLRKLMRAKKNYQYVLEKIFETQEVFLFIKKEASLSDYEMYQTFNMGMDYAIFLSSKDIKLAQNIIIKNNFHSIDAGYVEIGQRRVIIKPKNLIYESDTYKIK